MARSAVSEFVHLLGEIDRSKHRDEVFRDFCDLAYCALAKRASPFPEQRDALEAQYMDVVARYRDKDDVRRMPELLALAVHQISAGGSDFLGMVAGEIGALSAQLGQFFTPYKVSHLMAEVNLQGVDQIIADKGFVTVCEPAAGAGGMLLAVADVIEAEGYPLETSVWFEATELSQSTYHMGYIQITTRGLAGSVVCCNSLSLETFTSAYTAAALAFTARHGNPFAIEKAEAARLWPPSFRAYVEAWTGDYPKAHVFCTDVLGFTCTEEGGEPAKFGVFKRDGAVIFVNGYYGADATYDHWRAYFHVDDVDTLSREVRDAGGALSKDIWTTVYEMREFEVTDPDGNVLCFGADV